MKQKPPVCRKYEKEKNMVKQYDEDSISKPRMWETQQEKQPGFFNKSYKGKKMMEE